MITHDTKIRVWYKHTDQMGFVHHSNYICYYEEARSDLMRSMGLSYADMERKGIIMPILEVQSVYKRPAFFDDCLTVRILLREMPTARIRFEYEVYNSQGELLNTGMTTLGFLHADTHRPTRAPQWFVEALAEAMSRGCTLFGSRRSDNGLRPFVFVSLRLSFWQETCAGT